jgi:hypothetical protein
MTNNKMMVAVVATMAMGGGTAQAQGWTPEPQAQLAADRLANGFTRAGDKWEIADHAWCQEEFGHLSPDVPDKTMVTTTAPLPDPAAWPTGSLPPGKYQIGALRPVCRLITKVKGVDIFTRGAADVPDWVDSLKPGGFPDTAVAQLKSCQATYKAILDAGVAPTTKVEFQYKTKGAMTTFSGTVEEVKVQLCDASQKALAEVFEVNLAPYKKVLKKDKYRMMAEAYPGGFILPGGGMESDDAGKLAKANAWFYDLSASDGKIQCLNGQIHTVRRFAFDGSGKLLKTTEKQYCGEPPASAFR